MFCDVVEHIADPIPILEWARDLLSLGGYICAMIPNGAYISARTKILKGDWSYQDEGIFDRTHLRFYDTRTIANLRVSGMRQSWRWYWIRTPRWWPLPYRWSGAKWPNLLAHHVVVEWRQATDAWRGGSLDPPRRSRHRPKAR
jgi:hypothetical protein